MNVKFGGKRTMKTIGQQNTAGLRQQGMTLVELMIAIALGIFLTWGVMQAFLSGRQAYSLQQSLSRVQETGRLAQEFVDSDIRMSGDYGCGSSDGFLVVDASKPMPSVNSSCTDTRINLVNVGSNVMYDFGTVVYGYNNVTADPCGCLDPDPVNGTDVLVLHPTTDVGTLQSAVVMGVAPTSLSIQPTTGLADANAKFVAVADCAYVRLFQLSSDTGTIATSGPGTAACAQTAVRLEKASSVKRINTIIYYVALDAANGNIPTLYRKDQVSGLTEALLPGVEDFQLEFGVDSDSDNNVDSYSDADNVSADAWGVWDGLTGTTKLAVRAVRYAMLIRAEDSVMENSQTITFPPFVSNSQVTKTDRKMRMVYSGAVGVRSRVVMD